MESSILKLGATVALGGYFVGATLVLASVIAPRHFARLARQDDAMKYAVALIVSGVMFACGIFLQDVSDQLVQDNWEQSLRLDLDSALATDYENAIAPPGPDEFKRARSHVMSESTYAGELLSRLDRIYFVRGFGLAALITLGMAAATYFLRRASSVPGIVLLVSLAMLFLTYFSYTHEESSYARRVYGYRLAQWEASRIPEIQALEARLDSVVEELRCATDGC